MLFLLVHSIRDDSTVDINYSALLVINDGVIAVLMYPVVRLGVL